MRCCMGASRPYTVRLHFAEPEDGVEVGGRVFDVSLQGQVALANFDIRREAGGTRRSVVKTFTGVQIQDTLDIEFNAKAGAPR